MSYNRKRVLIVDFNHLAHIYNNAMASRMTWNFNGQVVDTTIAALATKAIWRWSASGTYPTAVCLDSPCPIRRQYFAQTFGISDKDSGYKGDRAASQSSLFDGIGMAVNIMKDNVSLYKALNYEADDLIQAVIDASKVTYPDYAIDVVTNDVDLLPLVDDQVSVFIRSRKHTYAIDPALEKNKYVQVTPETYAEELSRRSDYKSFSIPYNGVMLVKLLRGDPSDQIPGDLRRFPPRLLREMYDNLREIPGGEDIFRSGNWEEIKNFLLGYLNPEEDREYMDRIWYRYTLMCLNEAIVLPETGEERPPARVLAPTLIKEMPLRSRGNALGIKYAV